MEERVDLNPDDPRAWILAATAYAGLRDRSKAEEAIRRALAIEEDALTVYNAACAYALLGEETKALDSLEKAIEMGWKHKEWLAHDADFDFVRETPRFKRMIESLS